MPHQPHHHHHHHTPGQGSRKRDRTASPPLRATTRRTLRRSPPLSPQAPPDASTAEVHTVDKSLHDPALTALLRDSSFHAHNRDGVLLYDDELVAGTTEYARQRALQDVLRRTSLTEFRDRDIAEWLQEMEAWLQQSSAPGSTSGNGGTGRAPPAPLSSSSSSEYMSPSRGGAGAGRGTMNAEIRIAVLGVLDTLPWWRLVEGFAEDAPAGSSGGEATTPSAPNAANGGRPHPRTVPHAFVRWHERIQISFERVCVALIDQSPRAVQGVLEVLMRPFRVRPPVRDGAERSLPCDSVIRVLSHIAARYPASFVLDTLDQSMSTLVPKQRWPDRRHHVACVAILLHLALEAHVPIYTPQQGNQQSFAEARERFFSTAVSNAARRRRRDQRRGAAASSEEDGGAARHDRLRLPAHTGATSEESSTDASTTSTSTTGAAILGRAQAIPSGYRSTSGLFVESGIRLPPRSLAGFLHGNGAGTDGGGGVLSSDAEGVVETMTSSTRPKNVAAENPFNNKILAYRNEIIRFLLRHLFSMELTLERTSEASAAPCWMTGRSASPLTRRRSSVACSGGAGGHTVSGIWSPTTIPHDGGVGEDGGGISGGHTPFSFPASPNASLYHVAGGGGRGELDLDGGARTAGRAGERTGDASGGARAHDAKAAAAACAVLGRQFTPSATPFFRILLDCTTLVFDKLSADLRRQQAAGACGNADWWRELIVFHTHATLRAQQPVCLLYLAPSLALRGVGGEAADMLHKLISVVIKGAVPPQLQMAPRTGLRTASASSFAASGAGVGGGHSGSGGGGSIHSGGSGGGAGGAQPVRMRMAPPTAAGGMHAVPLEQRLRAAHFVFPLFRFLRSRLGGEEEGLRRRLLKWMAQEMRKAGTTGTSSGGLRASARRSVLTESALGAHGGSSLSLASSSSSLATMQLVEVVFAQCAAISELLNVDLVVAPTGATTAETVPNTSADAHTTSTSAPVSGGATPAVDAVTEALQPLLAKYTLQSHLTGIDADNSTASSAFRQLHLDMHQLELEGLLKPDLLDFCPWPLTDDM